MNQLPRTVCDNHPCDADTSKSHAAQAARGGVRFAFAQVQADQHGGFAIRPGKLFFTFSMNSHCRHQEYCGDGNP